MTTAVLQAFDIVLGLGLVALAAAVLGVSTNLFRSVVLFIVFGLMMALAWARLGAADIALVEAAVGAGLTGALLLNTLAELPGPADVAPRAPRRFAVQLPAILAAMAAGLPIAAAVASWPAAFVGLGERVDAHLAESGAANPVTAVLLNFRAYDTLLEIGVLVLAVVAVWALAPLPERGTGVERPGPVLAGFVRVLLPVVVLVAGYLLWVGTTAPGGAFQASAVLASAGVLLLVAGLAPPLQLRTSTARASLAVGLAAFLALGVAVMPGGRAFLELPRAWASSLILLLESLLAISIALVLVFLFAGGRPVPPAHGEGERR